MPDWEKVKIPLERCKGEDMCIGVKCPYFYDEKCEKTWRSDAIALMKAQEPVKPVILVQDAALSNGAKYLCGKCGGSFFHQKVNFCPWCGKAVNWE